MCLCYIVGGPWVAEDPDCPQHGIQAQRQESRRDQLRHRITQATTVEELRELLLHVLDSLEN